MALSISLFETRVDKFEVVYSAKLDGGSVLKQKFVYLWYAKFWKHTLCMPLLDIRRVYTELEI